MIIIPYLFPSLQVDGYTYMPSMDIVLSPYLGTDIPS